MNVTSHSLFSCLPYCTLAELGLWEWLIVIVFITIIYAVTAVFTRRTFVSAKPSPPSIKWHAPRIIFLAVVVGAITVPLVYYLFGWDVVRLYSRIIMPVMCIIAYLAYFVFGDESD